MSNKLTVLDDVQDFMLTCQKQDEADAIEWAIDQLRWRRVSEELPKPGDDTYQVLSEVRGKLYPDHALWCFENTWDGIPWRKTNIVYWRPIELPEGD